DLPGGSGRTAGAIELGADVVHDDLGPLGGEPQRMGPTDAATGSGDDDDTVLADARHWVVLLGNEISDGSSGYRSRPWTSASPSSPRTSRWTSSSWPVKPRPGGSRRCGPPSTPTSRPPARR